MEKTKLVFCSSDISDYDSEMVAYVNQHNEIYISISDNQEYLNNQFIALDLLTAIKFVKHLKKEIAFIKGMEVDNV
jgi:hypothetical protein